VKFGLLYEIQIPKPWTPGIERQYYHDVIEQVVLAESLGWEYVWAVEHHLLPEWSHCPAPEVLFGALSQRTTRIRIGHGVALLPKNFNHPLRVAERAAVLDILTNGRVDVGTGRAVTLQELRGFDVDPDLTKEMWREGIEVLPRAWRDEPFEFHGKHLTIPPSYVVPKPVQKPHPPLWLAGTNPETFITAGRHGLGLLGFVTGKPDDVARRLAGYKKAVADPEEPIGEFVNNQASILIQTYCAETREQAFADVQVPLETTARIGAQLFLPWAQEAPTRTYETYRYLVDQMRAGQEGRAGQNAAGQSVEERARDGLIAVGDPDDIVQLFKAYEEMGADQLMTWVQFGGLPHEKIVKSMELLAEHVLPKFGVRGVAARAAG
jgi:alkanesulfonate monooxygenase SsuD/methylene tetrahydromethanopterin reductase-like flavin-dependent oxidoreductase (luciferase family)